MSGEPEFGLSDMYILKETFDNIGVGYEENCRYKPLSYFNDDREVIGFSIDLEFGDAEFSFLFDLEGEFVETDLFTSW